MSYCRFGEGGSDVYLYGTSHGWECFLCRLDPARQTVKLATVGATLAHLQAHVAAGHIVPEWAFDELRAESAAHGEGWDGQEVR